MAKSAAASAAAPTPGSSAAARKKTVRSKKVPAAPLVEPAEIPDALPPDRLYVITKELCEKSSAKQAIFRAAQGHYFLEGVQQLELPDPDMSRNTLTAESLRLFSGKHHDCCRQQ